MDPYFLFAAIAGAFFLAGVVKGVIGLGLPTVGIGLLGLFMPPVQAAAILVIPSLATNIWQALTGGNFVALITRLWPMLVGICAGSFAGAVWLPSNSMMASRLLGIALALYAVLGLFNVRFTVPERWHVPIGVVMGIFTGAMTVATGVFAIPGIPYMQALQFERDELVQALGISFTISTIALAAALTHAGEFNTWIFIASGVALVAAPLGMLIGQALRHRISPQTFRIVFFVGLLVLGTHLSLRGLL